MAASPEPRSSGPLRVLAFCDYFSPGMGGGAERVAFEVYTRLAAAGAEVTVVTTGPSQPWPGLHPSIRVETVPSVDLRRLIGLQLSVARGGARRALELVRDRRPHLLHANSLEFQTSIAAARVARRTGVPLVLTAHIAGFEGLPQPVRSMGAAYERTVGSFILRRSARVIAVSDAVAGHLRRWPFLGGRVRVVPNGVDHEMFHPGPERAGAGPVEVLFVGRLISNKQPGAVLSAIRTLRAEGLDVRARFVGDGPMAGDLRKRAAADPALLDAVVFAGFRQDVAAELRAADVLVRPSLTDGMSLSLLEGMASGVCVVASDVPGNRSLIRDDETGFLFRAGDADALTAALRRAVREPEDRRRVAKAAHEASLRHSWERCADETRAVFDEVARR